MAWHFSTDRPVYMQLAERITRSVLTGEYQPGEQIPSVRQLAMEAAVNPNTVQHAFTELEGGGLIISRGTLGRFVTEDRAVIEACREQAARQLVRDFIENISQLSVTGQQAIAMIEEESL